VFEYQLNAGEVLFSNSRWTLHGWIQWRSTPVSLGSSDGNLFVVESRSGRVWVSADEPDDVCPILRNVFAAQLEADGAAGARDQRFRITYGTGGTGHVDVLKAAPLRRLRPAIVA
jgi:hypothetical protein